MFVGAFFRNTLLLNCLTFNRPSKKVQTLGFWVEMALFWHKVDETWFAWLFSLLARMYHEGWPVLESVHSNHGLLFLTDVYESLVIVGEWCWLPGIQWTEGFEIVWTINFPKKNNPKPAADRLLIHWGRGVFSHFPRGLVFNKWTEHSAAPPVSGRVLLRSWDFFSDHTLRCHQTWHFRDHSSWEIHNINGEMEKSLN